MKIMILSINNIHKSFMTGFAQNISKPILQGVSLHIKQGEIYGFLGLNGAGKTTTLETIMGFLTPDQGTITFFGNHVLDNTIRKKIGYAPDKTPYFEYLTGWENVMMIGEYAGVEKKKRETFGLHLFDELGLTYAKNNYVQNYSQGMKQRLGLILSLINDPDLLLWDEPMSGLDPLGRIVVKNLMKKLKAQGKTIIFSTHILSDVEEIADRFGILSEGKIIYEGDMKTITTNLEDFFCEQVTQSTTLQQIKIK
ncbi:putative ABC transporter ATP-binding protein YxlF [candidate division SR1 bacterium Aalborg_AAW-1]|nr:putative ABC transporter ATP-binding protein YxlF [candidate division SR1 bacterium Aalborg_AAW-1]